MNEQTEPREREYFRSFVYVYLKRGGSMLLKFIGLSVCFFTTYNVSLSFGRTMIEAELLGIAILLIAIAVMEE